MEKGINQLGSLFGFLPEEYRWIFKIFLVLTLFISFGYLLGEFVRRVAGRFARIGHAWKALVLESARRPVRLFVSMVGVLWALELLRLHFSWSIANYATKFPHVLIVLVLAWFLMRLVVRSEKLLTDASQVSKPVDVTTASAVGKLSNITIGVIALLMVLQAFGVSITGVLAFGGIGGVAVGFAAKDLLANFFGAMAIYFDRPFKVGDWIRSPDREIEGTVEEIGWRLTRIRTFDMRPLYVPNAAFSTISVENPSRMLHRRIYEKIGIRYCDGCKMTVIIDDVIAMLRAHPEMETDNCTMIVNFDSYRPSSLEFFVYTFTKTTNWVRYHEIKQDVLLKIYEIIQGHGADLAYPTTTLDVSDGSSAPRVQQAIDEIVAGRHGAMDQA